MFSFSIILPCYNEKDNIPILVNNIHKILKNYNYEIIIVDDNSPDGSYQVAKKLEATYPHLSSICRTRDRGLSSAVLTGFSIAKSAFFIVMDADLQHDPSVLPSFVQAYENGADMVIGSRKLENSNVNKSWPLKRKIISYIATFLAKVILPISISDPMSGFFGITKKIYLKHFKDVNPRGFKILLEFLVKAKNAKIHEIGFNFLTRQHGESKLSANIMFQYLTALYDLRFGKILSPDFIKYCMVGASGVFVNQITLWLLYDVSKQFIPSFQLNKEFALAFAIEISIIYNYFLNNYFTFSDIAIKGFFNNTVTLLKFNFICLLGAFINFSVAYYLNESYTINLYVSNLIGIMLATAWNYLINTQVTWKKV